MIGTETNYLNFPREKINLDNLGNGKILFFNGDYYCPLIECGINTKMNVQVNNVSFGQLNYGEYFIVEMNYGVYEVQLKHRDLFHMKSKHKLKIDKSTKVIKIEPTDFSNKITITNEVPKELESFRQLTE